CSVKREDESHTASVEALVRRCAECFGADGEILNGSFPRVLFLTHLWFMTSEQLLVLFTQLYPFKTCVCERTLVWLKEFPHVFDLDQSLVRALQLLQITATEDDDVDASIIDLSNKGSYKWMSEAHLSIRPNQVNRKRRKVSLVFNHLEPEELAIHISYLEYKCFRRLTLTDFHNYAVHGAIKENPKLERAVVLFNNITHWVQYMVLGHHKPQERAVAFAKFVEVAKKFYMMRNFNTLMAIVGALTHTVISRMKKTMSALPKETVKTLEEFVELLDSKSNYGGYRKAYSNVSQEFKIPIIGILMKDLIALHAALPDRVGDGLINVRKMLGIGGTFQEISYLQRTPFPYEVNRDLVNTLRVSLYLYYSEEEIYQLSLLREPREIKQNNAGNFVNMGFGEFARYTCHLDSDTIRQHVTAMVTSVFKAYDQNSDGFISEAEFEAFIRNFPGLDSFATVDKDQDGRISLSEMLDYFLKISSSRRNEVCRSFKHDFIETTFFHPTFCEECEKLLWGLVKQGWKCKGCGINCHKHCKERIVQECRPK
uniref:RAS guanyl releasing protein 3 n=1 Tax=Ciona savignyi TaxID=51511 RepID=H2YQA9_CIOSA